MVSCDLPLPARAAMMGLKSFTGYFSCPHCTHPGEYVVNNSGKGFVRYISTKTKPELRTDEKYIQDVKMVREGQKESLNGIISVSPMLMFQNFNPITGFQTDYMHCVTLGVAELMLDIWIGVKKSSRFQAINTMNLKILNERYLAIKPNSCVDGLPKSLLDRSLTWKAIDYKNALLYYLPCILFGIIDNERVQHFRKLSAGIYMLLNAKISHSTCIECDRLLNEFADEFQNLYGAELVTMNLHLLRHLAECVRRSGPLWIYSAFGFERNMGKLMKWKNNARAILEQIADTYCLQIERKKAVRAKSVKLSEKIRVVDDNLRNLVKSFELSTACLYAQVNRDSIIYKSKWSKVTKKNDHFVKMNDGKIGAVCVFIDNATKIYVIVRIYESISINNHFTKIQDTGAHKLFEMADVSKKLIFVKVGTKEIITKKPSIHCALDVNENGHQTDASSMANSVGPVHYINHENLEQIP